MKDVLKYLYNNTKIGYYTFHFFKWIIESLKYNKFTDKKYTLKKFQDTVGYELNLTSPKTFNEKLQWLKLYDNSSLKTKCADKFAVREVIEKEIGKKYLIPLVYRTKNHECILSENLPNFPIVLKANHFSGKVFIVRDKREICFDEIGTSLKYQLRKNFYHGHRELLYKNIEPCIIVEKLLLKSDGTIPSDFKIHCFNGEPKFVQVNDDRFNEHKVSVYDCEWNHQNVSWPPYPPSFSDKPKNLEEMLYLAKALSKKFLFVRVDLYECDEQVYFGELTFIPGAGLMKFNSAENDLLWGEMLELPIDKKPS